MKLPRASKAPTALGSHDEWVNRDKPALAAQVTGSRARVITTATARYATAPAGAHGSTASSRRPV
jgi:hypothetical protein